MAANSTHRRADLLLVSISLRRRRIWQPVTGKEPARRRTGGVPRLSKGNALAGYSRSLRRDEERLTRFEVGSATGPKRRAVPVLESHMSAISHHTAAPHVPASVVARAKAQLAKQTRVAAVSAREERAESPHSRTQEAAAAKAAAKAASKAVDVSA
jgi:hypothetical protein